MVPALLTAARALAPAAMRTVGSAGARRFAGQALADLTRRRGAAMASGRLRGAAGDIGGMQRVLNAVVPSTPMGWLTELGMEGVGAGITYAMLPEDAPRGMAALEQLGYGVGGSFLGRGVGGALAQSRVAGLRPRAAQELTNQWSGIGGMAGVATGLLDLQSLKGWRDGLQQQQELQLAQRDDEVRRQTLQGLQDPYAPDPRTTGLDAEYMKLLYG